MKDDEDQRKRPAAPSDPSSDFPSRNEFDFIEKIRQRANQAPASFTPLGLTLLHGIGDDAAVIKQPGDLQTLVTADLLVEEIDFQLHSTRPALLGHKALAVSLSDIAAMGGRPRFALLSIGVPREIWNSTFLDDFYEGFFALANQYDLRLIGGDVSRSPDKIVIDSIVLGEVRTGAEVLRSGAQPGDAIFLTGSLGGSAGGLRLLKRGARIDKSIADEKRGQLVQSLLVRHLCPEPRVGWGLVLGQEGLATSMIDVSDGLSSDLHHLCRESGVGALVDADAIPIDRAVSQLCGRRALDPLMLALHGGEDFELLFTVSPQNVPLLPTRVDGVPLTKIGEVREASKGIAISEGSRVWKLEPRGWDHFAR